MNGDNDNDTAGSEQLEQMREDLNVFQRLLSKCEDPSEKREALLSYCSEQAVEESDVWWNLALFRETGAEGLLYESPSERLFDSLSRALRQQILSGIPKIALEALADFRQLISFTVRLF